jgi:hypothetical protein
MTSLRERMDSSKSMVLIIGKTTKNDTDFVPYEIEYAIDNCDLPIIAVYTDYTAVYEPKGLRPLWPKPLAERIDSGVARVIHIGFRRALIDDAIGRYDLNNKPNGSLIYFNESHQKKLCPT